MSNQSVEERPIATDLNPARKLRARFLGTGLVIGLLMGVGLSAIYFVGIQPIFTAQAEKAISGQTSGQVALTETELKAIIKREGVTAYWSGPQANCLYSLEINANQQVFIRYLPDGKGIDDQQPNYAVIGTYPQADAFNVTKAAGSQANSISFVNSDGAQVYYSKSLAKNVYLAYPNVAYEIEIYNPVEGAALNLATASGKIMKIQ
jgi:hypothetical protein